MIKTFIKKKLIELDDNISTGLIFNENDYNDGEFNSINKNNNINNLNDSQLSQESQISEELDISKMIEIYNYSNSYTICKICGYFYFSETTNYRGDIPFYKRFWYSIRDFCVLNFKSLLHCCKITFCNVLNIICCGGGDKFNCECCSSNFNSKEYNKVSENFCYFYKEKRKYKWFHDYITSEIQEEIFPYVLEYFLLGLVNIAFQKKFNEFEYDFQIFNNKLDLKMPVIFIATFMAFLIISGVFGTANKKRKSFNKANESSLILSGIHGILMINSLISLTFSILHYLGKDFGDYILIPILIYKFFYFTLNYYCLGLSEQNKNYEIILTGPILFSIYIKTWHIFYNFLADSFENYILYIFQTALSSTIIFFYIYYLFFASEKFGLKEIICNNIINCNFCGCCDLCCIYNTYCLDGINYCDCCCCDDESCCYCKKCEKHFFSCNCCCCLSKGIRDDSINI